MGYPRSASAGWPAATSPSYKLLDHSSARNEIIDLVLRAGPKHPKAYAHVSDTLHTSLIDRGGTLLADDGGP